MLGRDFAPGGINSNGSVPIIFIEIDKTTVAIDAEIAESIYVKPA